MNINDNTERSMFVDYSKGANCVSKDCQKNYFFLLSSYFYELLNQETMLNRLNISDACGFQVPHTVN